MYTIYTKSNCAQCVTAKTLLKSEGIEFEEKNVEEDLEALQYLSQMGLRSMPQVLKNGSLIPNGLQGLQRLWREDKLK
jgi:glutaredoxin-like protein NrdH